VSGPERIETVIVGGGQAGLAMSHCLSRLGREHVVLERARVAERWRSERWDSLTFQFPNWSMRLPDHAYDGEPDAFAPRDEVVRFLEAYASRIHAPVRCGVTVHALDREPRHGRFVLETSAGAIEAANVVVATGPYQEPAIPACAGALPREIVQVHSSRYRHPAQLPPGAVLVAGSGASGCQIAEDLLDAGREVYLAVGRHRRVPRRYRGRDIFWWLERMGALDETVEQRPDARQQPNPLVTGVNGGHDVDLRLYAARGMVLAGHLRGVEDRRLHFADDLAEQMARGDDAYTAFIRAVEDHVARLGMNDGAGGEAAASREPARLTGPAMVDLDDTHITSVVWATGFRSDFGWVHVPILDAAGQPVHRRGVTTWPGLSLLGLPWLHTLKSSVLCGVGEDAAFIAEHIASRG